MRNLFTNNSNQANVATLFKKIFKGAGSYNFDDGTDMASRENLSGLIFKENFFGFYTLYFSLPDYDVECTAKLDSIDIKVLRKSKEASIYQEYPRKAFETIVDEDDNDFEKYPAVEFLIKKFSTVAPSKLQEVKDVFPYYRSVMGVDIIDGPYCFDKNLGRFIVNVLGLHTQSISYSEAKELSNIFVLDDIYVPFEKSRKAIVLNFEQSFDILKSKQHSKDNCFSFNDMDNFIYFIEHEDIQAVSYQTQNHLFLVAKNTLTGVLKIWNSMIINKSHCYIPGNVVNDSVFNVIDYFNYMIYPPFGQSYYYPFEFENDECRKSVDYLLTHFEDATSELLYHSQLGFVAEKQYYFNMLLDTLEYSNEVLTDEYDIEAKNLILTDMVVDSPDYLIRSLTSRFQSSRAGALHFLLTIMGNGYYWTGTGFSKNDTIFENLPHNKGEDNYSPLNTVDVFTFGKNSQFLNMPKEMTESWKKATFELSFYIKEWIEHHPNHENSMEFKEKVDEIYNTYKTDVFVAELSPKINRTMW